MITHKKFNRLIKILDRYIKDENIKIPFPNEVIDEFKELKIWQLWVHLVRNEQRDFFNPIMIARRKAFPKFITECQKIIIIIGKIP